LKRCFTIDSKNQITVHSSRKEAHETGRVSAAVVQFADLFGRDSKLQVKIWNGLPGAHAGSQVMHRKIASDRIGKVDWNFGELRGDPRERSASQPRRGGPPRLVALRCQRWAIGAPCCARQGEGGITYAQKAPETPGSPQPEA
jgi:hypothetical protein